MALLRRGSSRISEENFNSRLVREKAKTGAVSASLAWNDPSDLDLWAKVIFDKGGVTEICYRNPQAHGGYLDVDAHARDTELIDEPVENIFWKKPLAGTYSITAKLYKKRGTRENGVKFRSLLKREGEDDLSREGELTAEGKELEVFRFKVDEDGEISMGKVGTPLPEVKPAPPGFSSSSRKVLAVRARPARAMKAMKAKAMKVMKVKKVMKKPKAVMKKPKAMKKVSKVAKGKKKLVEVWRGKKTKTAKGLTKDDLIKSTSNKIVSKKKSEAGKKSKWNKAVAKARAVKGYTGFKAIKKGGSFYEKAKEFLAADN